MSEWKTIRVPADAFGQAKTQKDDHDRTWGEQIVRPDDEDESTEQNHEYERWATETEALENLKEQHAKTQELLERLPQDIAEELEGRFR